MSNAGSALRRVREDAPVLLPGALICAVVIAWAFDAGGYDARPALDAAYNPDPWYLGALALVALFGATALGVGRVRISGAAAVALLALAGYVLWSFASVLWASDQGAAFLGSDRALVYLAVFAAFAILPWRAGTLRVALAGLVAGLGAVLLATAVKLGTDLSPAGLYIHGRLASPLGYENASAALFMLTATTAVVLSAPRDAPAALRVAGVVLAGVGLQLAVLTQSRGWLFTVPIVVVLVLLLVPGRLRLLLFALAPALATAAVAPALLDVYSSASTHGLPLAGAALERVLHARGAHAAHQMLLADVALALVAGAMTVVDRRLRLSERTSRRADRAAAALLVAAALAGALVAVSAVHGDIGGRVERAWDSFASVKASKSGGSRFASLGSQRVDFWRVALHELRAHPLEGIGQDNFAAPYIAQRRTNQEPRWVHSLELRALTHTGIVGALLLAAFLAAALLAALRARRRAPWIVAAALAPFVVWLVHGSIDWFWEMPALSVPALAFLAGAGALAAPASRTGEAAAPAGGRARGEARADQARAGEARAGATRDGAAGQARRLRGAAFSLAALAATAAALVALLIPFAAAKDVQRALGAPLSQAGVAYARLRAAADLMPFDAQVPLVAGSLALSNDNPAIARSWFAEAHSDDPQSWLAPFALGLIEGERSRRAAARAWLRRAHALNPRDSVVTLALERAGSAHPLTFEEAQRRFAARSLERFGR
jgi:O-antigen ligase/polysaccharide polymerase Wzy-like membrane protein